MRFDHRKGILVLLPEMLHYCCSSCVLLLWVCNLTYLDLSCQTSSLFKEGGDKKRIQRVKYSLSSTNLQCFQLVLCFFWESNLTVFHKEIISASKWGTHFHIRVLLWTLFLHWKLSHMSPLSAQHILHLQKPKTHGMKIIVYMTVVWDCQSQKWYQ